MTVLHFFLTRQQKFNFVLQVTTRSGSHHPSPQYRGIGVVSLISYVQLGEGARNFSSFTTQRKMELQATVIIIIQRAGEHDHPSFQIYQAARIYPHAFSNSNLPHRVPEYIILTRHLLRVGRHFGSRLTSGPALPRPMRSECISRSSTFELFIELKHLNLMHRACRESRTLLLASFVFSTNLRLVLLAAHTSTSYVLT